MEKEVEGVHLIRNASISNLIINQVRMRNIFFSQRTPLPNFAVKWYEAAMKQHASAVNLPSKLKEVQGERL